MRPEAVRAGEALDRVALLELACAGGRAEEVVAGTLAEFGGSVALVSSFGADSTVLLHMVAQVDPHVPVLMIDTLMLFEETLAYQRMLADRLGLTNVCHLRAEEAALAALDPDGMLHRRDPDACCALRKVAPLERALARWPVTISGRKRHQTAARAGLRVFERDGDRLKVNPLAAWTAAELQAYRVAHGLPAHPLVARGFRSIGCAPCTTPVGEGENDRAGRWRGSDKVECGIHFGPDGRVRRTSEGAFA